MLVGMKNGVALVVQRIWNGYWIIYQMVKNKLLLAHI
jgi:hypothetical protein